MTNRLHVLALCAAASLATIQPALAVAPDRLASDADVVFPCGRYVVGLGDTNVDGFDDVVLAAGADCGLSTAIIDCGPDGFVLQAIALPNAILAAAFVGDFDADGIGDVVLGLGGGASVHSARVYSGATGDPLLTLLSGELPGDGFGSAVAGAGVADGDGHTDILVGAPTDDTNGKNSGRAYIYSGATGAVLQVLSGEAAGDLFGSAVASAGDIDHDGYADVLVGAPRALGTGRAYVFSGLTGALLHTLTGQRLNSQFGFAVADAGDMNGDGWDDLIVSAPLDIAARAYVFSGQTGSLLYTLHGQGPFDRFGWAVAGLGDVNGDGLADCIVGAPFYSVPGPRAGRAYIYSGGTGDVLFTLTGERLSDGTTFEFGASVSSAGDFNGDGKRDILVGTGLGGAAGYARGAYVFLTEPTASSCPADVNHDGSVNSIDLATVLGSWGACP